MIHPIKHFITITKHRHLVIKLGFKCGIKWQVLFHDLSKFSPTEFKIGMKYYQGNASPNSKEIELFGYSKAWLHHRGRNKHHFEYWTIYDVKTSRMIALKMPINYVKEMFCDRVAATKIYQKEKYTPNRVYEYYLSKNEDKFLHPKTKELLEKWMKMLIEKGEKETLREIKKTKCY